MFQSTQLPFFQWHTLVKVRRFRLRTKWKNCVCFFLEKHGFQHQGNSILIELYGIPSREKRRY